jgi:hypothetical protein
MLEFWYIFLACLCWPLGYIFIFYVFWWQQLNEIGLIIYLVENKFKQIYMKIINKHEELNEEINQQIKDAKQVKT